MDPETDTPTVTHDPDIEATLRDVAAFLNDPVALLERALEVLRRRANLTKTAAVKSNR